MAKVCKLKWNLRAAKTQISMRGNRVYWGLHPQSLTSTMSSLNQTKCFMMMANFMDLHGNLKLCLHCRIIHKNCLCLHDTPRKTAMVYTISRSIFGNSHIIIQDDFSELSGLEDEFQGLGLWYIVKESRYLLLSRQNDKTIGCISASFPLSTSHSLLSVNILLNRSNYAKRIGKS